MCGGFIRFGGIQELLNGTTINSTRTTHNTSKSEQATDNRLQPSTISKTKGASNNKKARPIPDYVLTGLQKCLRRAADLHLIY
jgi:hypothetical protein